MKNNDLRRHQGRAVVAELWADVELDDIRANGPQ